VIEGRRFPALRLVARGAVRAELALVRVILLVAADADAGDTLTYSMALKDGDDSPLVTVDPTTGEVTLTTSQVGTDLQSLRFKAVVTDRSGLTDEREITVTLPAGSG
jgi:hypothetical protein